MLRIAHQFHRRVWQAVRCPPVPPLRLAGCSLPISSTAAFGRLHIFHESDRRSAQTVDRPSVPPCCLARCISPIDSRIAFGTLSIAHHIHHRIWNADPRPSGTRGANESGRSRSAPRAKRLLPSQAFVETRRREPLPCGQPSERFSVVKAQRRGRTPRSAKRLHLRCDPPRCATKSERGTMPYGSSLLPIGKPYTTERARPTRHCS
jgi:hypothetical protein